MEKRRFVYNGKTVDVDPTSTATDAQIVTEIEKLDKMLKDGRIDKSQVHISGGMLMVFGEGIQVTYWLDFSHATAY